MFVVALLVAGFIVAASSPHDPPAAQQYPEPRVTPTASPTSMPSAATPSASPTSQPATIQASPVPMQTVPPGRPVHLSIPSIGVSTGFEPLRNIGTSQNIVLKPPYETQPQLSTAWWWIDRPAPAVPVQGATYVLGHRCKQCVGVFDRLNTVRLGAQIVVTTQTGRFTYQVACTGTAPFDDPIVMGSVMSRSDVPNERPLGVKPHVVDQPSCSPQAQEEHYPLILTTCYRPVDKGNFTDNFIVWAALVKAERI